MQDCTENLDQLRHEHSAERAAHSALREEAGKLRGRLAELGGVEEKLVSLQQQHSAAAAKLEQLEQEKLVGAAAVLLWHLACLPLLAACLEAA
jgi:copper oxidase (laccase) domain-containing protein